MVQNVIHSALPTLPIASVLACAEAADVRVHGVGHRKPDRRRSPEQTLLLLYVNKTAVASSLLNMRLADLA